MSSPARQEPPKSPVGWKTVLLVLIGLPLGLALSLSVWLGTPQERLASNETFAKLGLPAVPTRRIESLAYNRLFFVRLEFDEVQGREFLRALSGFVVSRGVPEAPISLKLERPWWDPPARQEGTLWERGEVSVWNPDSRPDVFYAVFATHTAGGGLLVSSPTPSVNQAER